MTEFGNIEDFKKKKNLGEDLQSTVDFLTCSDHQAVFNQLEKGSSQKVEIDGERIFAVYQNYDSKDGSKPIFEAHRKFIDVQYLHSGSELIFVSDIEGAKVNQAYDEENDFELFELKQWSTLRMKAGMASVLYPEDLHAPCILCGQSQLIEKVVVKVKID